MARNCFACFNKNIEKPSQNENSQVRFDLVMEMGFFSSIKMQEKVKIVGLDAQMFFLSLTLFMGVNPKDSTRTRLDSTNLDSGFDITLKLSRARNQNILRD